MSNLFSSEWLRLQAERQREFADLAAGFLRLGLEGSSRLCDVNFRSSRQLLADSQAGMDALRADPALGVKLAGKSLADGQAYCREIGELFVDLQQKTRVLVDNHVGAVRMSAEALVSETRKVSPGTSEIVGSALRSWVDGARNAMEQMAQLSQQINEAAQQNSGAWQTVAVVNKAKAKERVAA